MISPIRTSRLRLRDGVFVLGQPMGIRHRLRLDPKTDFCIINIYRNEMRPIIEKSARRQLDLDFFACGNFYFFPVPIAYNATIGAVQPALCFHAVFRADRKHDLNGRTFVFFNIDAVDSYIIYGGIALVYLI